MTPTDTIEGHEIATLLEVTPQRVSYMTRQGIIAQDGAGHYPLRETLHALFRWYRTRLGEGKSAEALENMKGKRIKNAILEEALRRTRGETITLAEAEKVQGDLVLRAREKLLRIGNKLADQITYLGTASAIEEAIRKEIEEALGELSRPVEYRPQGQE